jgi:NACalpha-BTF3-like transcription factor
MSQRKKRNPARTGQKLPFPHFMPDYPVKPWVNPETGERFQTVSVDLPDGTFLAFIAEAPEVRATARSRAEAEQMVLAMWRQPETQRAHRKEELRRRARRNPEALTEDDIDLLLVEDAGGPWHRAEDVLREFGYDEAGRPLK